MTAYLQPGDKIHLSVPWNLDDKNFEDRERELRAAYELLGIEVVFFTDCDHRLPVEVIAVIRPKAPDFEDWLPPSAD